MSQHKFASNVVEKLLQLSDSETRTMMLNEITGMRQYLYFCTSKQVFFTSKKSTNTRSEIAHDDAQGDNRHAYGLSRGADATRA